MKKIIALVFLTGLMFSFPIDTIAQDFNKISGEWIFNTPDAAYGYGTGTITFTKEGSEIKGEVKFTEGYKIELKNIVIEGNELNFGLFIEYEYIEVKMILEKGKLAGKVSTSDGNLGITAERESSAKK